MMKFFILLTLITSTILRANPLKHENEGCPENSLCSKDTGLIRLRWLEILKKLKEDKISESVATKLSKDNGGIPINIWSNDNESIKEKGVLLWDSPCKQHHPPNQKYFIGEYFTNKIFSAPQKNSKILWANLIIKEQNEIKIIKVPRGDAPLLIENKSLYYTKDDEGIYYGLKLSSKGDLSISHPKHISKFPREVDCPKDMTEIFIRNSPSLNFFKGYFCKEIWNSDTNSYSTTLIGWSCN